LIVGPGPDTTARAIGAKIGATLGQPIVVDQLPGAGGVVAAQTVAKAPADGHTLLLTTGSYSIMQAIQPGINFNLERDFEPVAQVASLGFVLLAHPDVPANSLDELIQLAKNKPGALNCASTGIGTTAHLGCEMLRTYAKIDFVHVPFKGNPPAVIDLLAGRVHFFFSTGPALTHVAAGKLKALAVTGPKRMNAIGTVPTVEESGMPQLSFISWNGVHAPKGTPHSIISRLSTEIVRAAGLPDIQQTLIKQGFDPDPKDAEAFGVFVRSDVERWSRAVTETGAKAY
jgi:tripartite-type tricarboxylate transporter receptor subunit TctC